MKNHAKTLHISGQLGIDPQNSTLVQGGIESEFEQIVQNMKNILHQSGAQLKYTLFAHFFSKYLFVFLSFFQSILDQGRAQIV